MNSEQLYRYACWHSQSLSPLVFRRLISVFKSAEAVFKSTADELCRAGIKPSVAQKFCAAKDYDAAMREYEQLPALKITVLLDDNPRYPVLLKHIPDAPIVLYALGNPDILSEPAVAVVGARKCSGYSRQCTAEISERLAVSGITVVSGMAMGVDACAHTAALKAGGKTAAVLASHVTHPYPATNRGIYRQIAEHGCIVSEYRLETYPQPFMFPVRNRIIAGMCQATVIIEAASRSGTIITAHHAADYSRDVWVVPGLISDPGFAGSHRLIAEGAAICTSAEDILLDLGIVMSAEPELNLSSAEQKITAILSRGGLTAAEIIDQLEDGNKNEYELLFSLEMKGIICRHAGVYFLKQTSGNMQSKKNL